MPGRGLPNRLHVRDAIGSERCAGGDPQRGERHTVSSWSRRPARYHRMVSHHRGHTHNRRHPLGRGRRTREGKGDSSAARQTRSSGPGAAGWTVLQVLRRRHERQHHLLSQLRKIPVLTGCVTVPSSRLGMIFLFVVMSPLRVSQQPGPLHAGSAGCCCASGWPGRRAPPNRSRRVSAV